MNYKLETTADGALRVSVGNEAGNKYAFVKPDPTKGTGYGVSILRYGEPWVEHPPGENAIADLLWLVEELHNKVEVYERQLNAAVDRCLETNQSLQDAINKIGNKL